MKMKIGFQSAVLFGFLFWVTPVAAQPDLQDQAEAALVSGNPAETASLARDILTENPDSFVGLYLLGLAQSDLGDTAQAVTTGQQAYAIATTEEARFQAARLVASARFRAKQYARSEFWLRRAANHAQTPQDFESISRAYIRTIRENPLSVQFTAYVAPSDNVNNGSEDGILRLESIGLTLELPEDRRSLSGVAFAAGANLSYRLSLSETQRSFLTAKVFGQTYVLSSEAEGLLASSPSAEVRAVEGSDFATLIAEIGLRREQRNLSPLGPVNFSFALGRYWEAGVHLINYQDYAVEQIIPVGQDSAFSFGAFYRDQKSLTPTLLDTETYDLTAGYSRQLANGDRIQLNLLSRQRVAGPESSFDEYQIGIGYGVAKPVLGTRLSTSLQLGYREFDEFTTTLDGRRDNFVTAEVDATFVDFTYFGFSPSMSLSATRTESSAEENTSSTLQLLVGIESNF